MIMTLEAKNKLGFVDGMIKAPTTTSAKYPIWRRCNQMIKSWILNSISPSLANTVIYANTTAEVWLDLKELFSQGNISMIFQIKQDISKLQQHQQSISVYCNTLKGLWDELGSYAHMPSLCQIKAILRGDGKNQASTNATGMTKPQCYTFATDHPDYWIIDSGASDHITFSSKLIPEKSSPFNSSITMPNGTQAKITCVGTTTKSEKHDQKNTTV
ncbi:unnamed protein product [Prunus armeniaca]